MIAIYEIVSGIVSEAAHILMIIAEIMSYVVNVVAVIILIIYAVKGIIAVIKKDDSSSHILSKGISKALAFNLVAETFTIVTNHDYGDILLVALIIIVKIMITFLFILELKEANLEILQEEFEKKHSKKNKKGNVLNIFKKKK